MCNIHPRPPRRVFIGRVRHSLAPKQWVVFKDHQEATAAWWELTRQGIPAFLDCFLDGLLLNHKMLGQEVKIPDGLPDVLIPDIKITKRITASSVTYEIYSRACRCEFLTGADRLWEHVAGVIRDYRDAVEAGL